MANPKFGIRYQDVAGNQEKFEIKSNGVALLEDEIGVGAEFIFSNLRGYGVKLTRTVLYAALYESKVKKREPWTPQLAGKLLDEHIEKGGSHQEILYSGMQCVSDHFPNMKKIMETVDSEEGEDPKEAENPPEEIDSSTKKDS